MYLIAVRLVRALVRAAFRVRVEGAGLLPIRGPVVVAAMHVSYRDPLVLGATLDRLGRRVRFMTRAELFTAPVVGWVLRRGGQIPVVRGARDGVALAGAAATLRAGACVVIYPEGTIVRTGPPPPVRAGVGRLALTSRAPVVPVAMWGMQWRLRPLFRRLLPAPVGVVIGPVVPLDDLTGDTADDTRAAAERIMAAVRALVPRAQELADG